LFVFSSFSEDEKKEEEEEEGSQDRIYVTPERHAHYLLGKILV